MQTTVAPLVASLMFLAGGMSHSLAEEAPSPDILFPKALAPGDTIMFVAPAGPFEQRAIDRAQKRLEELGFRVVQPKNLNRKTGYLAGTDQQRADELMAAFTDKEVDAVFTVRGGYGTMRILDLLDYDLIRENPKIITGYSDITALHTAIHQRTGLVTFHSPNPEGGLGSNSGLAPLADKWFWRAIGPHPFNREPGGAGYTIQVTPDDKGVPEPTTLVAGGGVGRLVGGNLSLVHALMGTPYELETDGKILFLEDIGEAPYRIDRMLQTLKLGGKLDNVAGVVLGAFTRRKEEDTSSEETTINDVLDDYFAEASYAVLRDFPVGHQPHNITLPIGVRVRLDATGKTLTLIENPVTRR